MTVQTSFADAALDLKPVSRAILFIDVAGSLRVCRQLGDARAYQVLRFLSQTIHQATSGSGKVVRSLGDGFVLAFDSVDEAVAHAAIAQAAVTRCNPTEVPIKIRCGIHYGDVVEAEGDLFGVSMYLASRVCNHAHGGEILLTGGAREASTVDPHCLTDFGPTLLAGFEDPVPLYAYSWS